MTTQRKDARKQSRWVSLLTWAAVLMCCVMLGLALRVVPHRKARTQPPQFTGDWSIAGLQGDPRGTLTLSPAGQVDSHDDFLGRWWLEDGTMHVQFWDGSPDSLLERVFPKRDEFIFTTKGPQQNLPTVMQGAYVVLTRAGSLSQ